MPRGAAPEWRKRKEPVTDEWIMASVNRCGGLGYYDPQTGKYADLIIRGLDTREEAEDWVKALYRCAHWLNRNNIAPVSMSTDPIERNGSGYQIRFRAIDKTMARAHVLARYCKDRSRWPYDPRARAMAGA